MVKPIWAEIEAENEIDARNRGVFVSMVSYAMEAP